MFGGLGGKVTYDSNSGGAFNQPGVTEITLPVAWPFGNVFDAFTGPHIWLGR
jgi:hypothetical protein